MNFTHFSVFQMLNIPQSAILTHLESCRVVCEQAQRKVLYQFPAHLFHFLWEVYAILHIKYAGFLLEE